MARPLRIQYPGAFYHITNRGNERKRIFKDDLDRTQFLELLRQSLSNYQVVLHSFVLMSNHYHFLVETPLGNLSEFMRHFNITYTSYFNRRYNRVGHLFQGRYKSVLVDKDSYLTAVSKYIHLNPVKIRGLIRKPAVEQMKYLSRYIWSSLQGFISLQKRYEFVCYDFVLDSFGGDTQKGRISYKEQLELDLGKGGSIKDKVIAQSILGGENFVAWAKENFLESSKEREQPAVGKLYSYIAQNKILQQVSTMTGKTVDEILHTKGEIRQVAMELLYKFGGMKNKEIGTLMKIDYSTVSQGRKRLKEKQRKNRQLDSLVNALEHAVSRIKI